MPLKDLKGQVVGLLTVLDEHRRHVTPSGSRVTQWRCRCECGNERWVGSDKLVQGTTRSCGCAKKRFQAEKCRERWGSESIAGQRFGMLTVAPGQDHATKFGSTTRWRVICDCGTETWVARTNLIRGQKSCGCHKITHGGYRRHTIAAGEIPTLYWTNLSNNAKERDLSFEIGPDFTWALMLRQGRSCALSGLAIGFGDNTASLDRIDSSQGYVEGNVQWVHKDINRLKMAFDETRFIELCRAVADHSKARHKAA